MHPNRAEGSNPGVVVVQPAKNGNGNGLGPLLRALPLLLTFSTIVGVSYVGHYRIGRNEEDITKIRTDAVDHEKTQADSLEQIKHTVGNMQLDIAFLCTSQAIKDGKDPRVQCFTSRGTR